MDFTSPEQTSEIWQAATRILQTNLTDTQYKPWIEPLCISSISREGANYLVNVGAPRDFTADWVRKHYKDQIESALSQVTGTQCQIDFTVVPLGSDQNPYQSNFEETHVKELLASDVRSPTTSVASLTGGYRAAGLESRLDPRQTFESFVVGASNQFTHASAVAVAEQPGTLYNPLFIYSPPGLGKTHLLHAIGNHVLQRNPSARIVYLSAEQFVNELIESLQRKQMIEFRRKYRDSFDLILIDDIQFIAGKSSSEEEFFHTFNALHTSRRQIVMTSDRAPKEIDGLEDRIRSRFEWGLVADIKVPEIETRIAILKNKAERDDVYLPDDVALFLASCVKSNVRELEGLLVKLKAHASLSGVEISLEMAKQELKALLPEEGAQFSLESIQTAVARHFEIKISDLKSQSRQRKFAFPRQIAMFLIRKYTGMGYKDIGHYFGGKDHTTVMHAVTKIEEGFENDDKIRELVEAVQNRL